MADPATDLTALYSPTPVPAPLGEGYKQTAPYSGGFTPAQEAMTKSLSGIDITGPTPQLPFGKMPMFATEDIANVGGVTGGVAEDTTTFVPESIDPLEEAYEGTVTEFHDAAKGIDTKGKHLSRANLFNLGDYGEGKVTGKTAAKIAKREDRKGDRKARKKAGLKGSEKRQMRKAQRAQRKDAWQTYKGESDLAAAEQAAQLELL